MKISFQEQIIEFDNEPSAKNIIAKINDLLDKDYYFSHFIADGTEVYEDHESYLKQHLGRINQLEIITRTVKEFTNDILLSAESYSARAKSFMSPLAIEFYNNPTTETWSKFQELLEGVQWVTGILNLLQGQEVKLANWASYKEIRTGLEEELVNLQEAMENEDFVLIGDIIQYEIKHNFEALHEVAKTTIDIDGIRPNLN